MTQAVPAADAVCLPLPYRRNRQFPVTRGCSRELRVPVRVLGLVSLAIAARRLRAASPP